MANDASLVAFQDARDAVASTAANERLSCSSA
jgi:hypothetical protein